MSNVVMNRGESVVAVYRYRDMFTEISSSPLTAGISNVSKYKYWET